MKKQKSVNDGILKDLFSRMEIFEPPEGFTDRVMNRVAVEEPYSYQTKRPLISKTGWIIMAVLIIGLITVGILAGQGNTDNISQYNNLDYSINLDFVNAFIDWLNSLLTFSTSTWLYILLGIIIASVFIIADRIFSMIRSDSRF